jgi:short-subunit dehydrogenase
MSAPVSSLRGARVLLTGATGGLGQTIARELASRGATLVLSGRRTDVLEPLAAAIGATTLAVDLADRDSVHRLAREAGAVDVLVANAALPGAGVFTEFEVDEIDRTLDVNLRAPMLLAHALAPGMAERGRGQLVFMSSLAGKAIAARGSLYAATKFGLRGFAFGLRGDLAADNVGVTTIFPGFIRDAGMFHDSGAKLPPGIGTKAPRDVALAVVRAIERNPPEIGVAPFVLRAGVSFVGMAPNIADVLARVLGADRVAAELESGHERKR